MSSQRKRTGPPVPGRNPIARFYRVENAVIEFIKQTLHIEIQPDFHTQIRDGIILCKFMNTLFPRSIPTINEDSSKPFFQIKWNITFFIEASMDIGVPSFMLFTEQELYAVRTPPKTIHVLELICKIYEQRNHEKNILNALKFSTILQAASDVSTTKHDKELIEAELQGALLLRERALKKSGSKIWAKNDDYFSNAHATQAPILAVSNHRVSIPKSTLTYAKRFAEDETLLASLIRLQALVKMYRQRKIFKRTVREEAYRVNIVREILSTEEIYVTNLQLLINVFMLPLMAADSTVPLHHLHAEIEIILAFSKLLLEDLRPRVEHWHPSQCLGDIFIGIADYMKVYSHYVADYGQFISSLPTFMKDAAFAKQFKICNNNPEAKGKLVEAYMIMPVQRIPRYELLLKDLTRHTHVSHPDYINLQTAFLKMQSVAKYVNEKKGEFENMLKVVELQKLFVGSYTPLAHRRFVTEIDVLMLPVMKARSVILFSDILLIVKHSISHHRKISTIKIYHNFNLEEIEVRNLEDNESSKANFQIRVTSKNSIIPLSAQQVAVREQFFQLLVHQQNCIANNNLNRKADVHKMHSDPPCGSSSSSSRRGSSSESAGPGSNSNSRVETESSSTDETGIVKLRRTKMEEAAKRANSRQDFMKTISMRIVPGASAEDVLALLNEAEVAQEIKKSPVDKKERKRKEQFTKQLSKALDPKEKERERAEQSRSPKQRVSKLGTGMFKRSVKSLKKLSHFDDIVHSDEARPAASAPKPAADDISIENPTIKDPPAVSRRRVTTVLRPPLQRQRSRSIG